MTSIRVTRSAAELTLALFAIGLVASAAVPVLAQASGTWTNTGTLNLPRNGHTATLLPNGQVLVTGGESSSGTIVASAELFNPATGKWTVTGNMANARTNHTATLLPNGEVLVVGSAGWTWYFLRHLLEFWLLPHDRGLRATDQ